MKYFEGIDFIAWGAHPEYDFFITRGYAQPADSPDAGRVIEFCQFALQFNYSGRFIFSMNNGKQKMYEGAYAWITMPGEKSRYGSPPGETRYHRHVNFLGSRVRAFIDRELISGKPTTAPVPITRPDEFARQFDDVLERLNQQRFEYATHLLEGLLYTMQLQPPSAGDYLTPKIKKLALAISDHPEKRWNFEAEARAMCISHDHFRRLFRKTIHLAPGKYLTGCRLQRAAELLRSSSDTIIEISEKIGISDIHYFTRLFSRQYKLPPAKYRQHLNEVAG